MIKVKFMSIRGGMHGGMMFQPSVKVYRFSPTKTNPERFELWFSTPTMTEARQELDKRSKRSGGWVDCGQM